jgi:hypothetical protein
MADLVVEINAKIDGFKKQLTESQKELQKFGKNMTKIGKDLTLAISTPLAAVGVAAFAASVKLGNYADKLLDLEQQTGLTTDSLQKYRAVTTQAGIATDAVARASENLQRRLASGEEGSKDLTDGLKALGVSARDSAGNLRSIDNILEESISKLSDYSDITERNQLALKIFGRSASELAPLLALGSKGIEDAKNRAVELGLVLSKDALEGANQFRIQIDTLKDSLGGIGNEIGIAFLPVAKELVKILQENVIPVVRSIIGFFNGLSDSTKKIIAIVGGLVIAIGPLLAGLGFFVTTILPALKVGLIAVSALFSPLALKIIAITAAVVGLGLVVKGLIDSWDTVTEFFSQLWDKVKLLFINGVKNTLIAFQKFTSVIGIEFQDTIDSLEANASRIKTALDAKPVVTLGDVFSDIGQSIKNTFTSVKDSIVGSMDESKQAIVETATALGGLTGTRRTQQTAIGGGGGRNPFANGVGSSTPSGGVDATSRSFGVGDLLANITNSLDSQIPGVIDRLTTFAQNVNDILKNEVAASFTDLSFAIGEALTSGGNVIKAIGQSLLDSIGSFLGQLGQQLIAYGVAGIAFGKLTAAIAAGGPLSVGAGIAAIAAGAALVAISGGIRGLANKGVSGVGSSRGSFGAGSGGQGQTFAGSQTSGLFESERFISLALEPVISGDQIKFVLDQSNQRRN